MVETLPKLKEVIIDGVDVSSHIMIATSIDDDDTNIKTCVIGLRSSVSSLITYDDTSLIGKTITFKRGILTADEEFIFEGYIRKVSFKGGIATLTCEDMLSEAKYTIINTSFDFNVDSEAGVISEIFKTLINNNLSITANPSYIIDSGLINIIKRITFRQKVLMDALTEIAYLIDWQFYYNPVTSSVHFEPKGYTTSSTVFATNTNIVKLPVWDIDSRQLFNRIVLKGSPEELMKEEGPYRLDGSQSGWTTDGIILENKPVTTQVFCDTNATPTTQKIGGVENSSSSYHYETSQEQKAIYWSNTFNPTTSYYAKVIYTYNVPIQIARKNSTSIAAYGLKSVSQFRKQIRTVSDAEDWAQSQLQMYSEPFYLTTLNIRGVQNIRSGIIHNVIDNVHDINRNLLVKKVTITWPYRHDEVLVSDKEWRTANWGQETKQRLKSLEENQSDNEDIFNNVIDLERVGFVDRRYMKLVHKDRTNDGDGVFILAHPTYGILGTQKLGDINNYWGTKKLVHRDNIYNEYLFDNDFFDVQTNCEAYYNFENENHVVDMTGNHSTATVDGATYTSYGKIGNCFSFDGSNDYISTGWSTAGVRSISFWYYHETPTGTNTLKLLVGKTTGYYPAIGVQPNQQRIMLYTGVSDILVQQSNLTLNSWHFVTVVLNGASSKMFINGEDQTSTIIGTINTSAFDNAETFDIGGGVTGRYVQGKIDEVGFWTDQKDLQWHKEQYNLGRGQSSIFGSTLNTTTKTLTLNSYESVISKEIAIGPQYSYFTVTTGDNTGSYEIKTLINGKIQDVIEGSRTAITETGTNIRFMLSETAGSTATFTPSYDVYDGYTYPAIKVKLEE